MSYCQALVCYDYEVANGFCLRHTPGDLKKQSARAIIAELTETANLEDDPLAELCFEKFQKLGLTPKGSAVLRPYDFVFGRHTLTLFQYWVDSDTPLWTRVYDEPLPKGALAWKSGIYLANYLVETYATGFQPKNVLELGSGIGLGGVCIDKLHQGRDDDWKLVLTDGDDAVLMILQVHLRLNRCQPRTTCEKLSWGTALSEFSERNGRFDFIIGADVVYEETSIRPLWETVRALLSKEPEARFVLVQETRSQRLIDEAIVAGREFGFAIEHIQHPAPQGLSASDFVLLEARWLSGNKL
jgi:predicted nicotinamide N-methyase